MGRTLFDDEQHLDFCEKMEASRADMRKYTDEELVLELRRGFELGLTTAVSWHKGYIEHGLPSSRTFFLRFGSWNRAKQLAGLSDDAPRGRRSASFTRVDCIQAGILCHDYWGKLPTVYEYEQWMNVMGYAGGSRGSRGKYPGSSYVRELMGSWHELLISVENVIKRRNLP